LALEISNGLAKKGVLDPGFVIPQSDVESHLYLELTEQYSAAMAAKYADLTADLLEEIVVFIGPLSNEKQRQYKQYMLRVR
jgi:hypothetical protein